MIKGVSTFPRKDGAGASIAGDADRLAEITSEIGLRVRRTRQKRGLTRKQLAARSGISLRYLAQLEGGNANVSVAVLWRVAESLGVGLVEFIPQTHRLVPRTEPLEHLVQRLSPRERQWAYELLLRNLGAVADRKRGVALVGLRGAGKSTLGERLAKKYNVPFVRLGDAIAELGSMEIGELFSLGGQTLYRRLEHQALQHVILGHDVMVLEVGGSLVMQEMTHDLLLRSFRTVWVRASAEEHMQRVLQQGDLRPMAGNAEAAMGDLRAILDQREPRYRLSDHVLDTSGRDVESCLRELVRLGAEPLSPTSRGQGAAAG
ncbi:MAG: helix-turn-helix domain-containing protein [Proteobacteria bacterium]|nr:MAG: helix-turn-helix domain-containing protein [Pseudomonadota bacterium]